MEASIGYVRRLEADVLARTAWGEARGEGTPGMQAVACVVMNRVAVAKDKGGYWWGNDVIHVCQKPFQFSCWNRGDVNFPLAQAADRHDAAFAAAMEIAAQAVAGALTDSTHGATHYHALGVTPDWAAGQTPTAVIGRHVFYRIID